MAASHADLVARHGYPPFAPAVVAVPRLLSQGRRKATGHLFADCPAIDAPLPKTKEKGCEPCRTEWNRIGVIQAENQRRYDERWFAEREAPTTTPTPLPTTEKTMMNESTVTPKQLAFLKDLFAERKGNEEAMAVRAGLLIAYKEGRLTREQASQYIDRIKAMPKDPRPPTGGGEALPDVPAGHYAVPSNGQNDLMFVRIDRPTEGRWAGRTFGKMIVGGQPESMIPWKHLPSVLARIIEAGVAESAALYGQEIGRCWRCNRTLTDETSRREGIGPECAKAV